MGQKYAKECYLSIKKNMVMFAENEWIENY